jgi:hypothetical protein
VRRKDSCWSNAQERIVLICGASLEIQEKCECNKREIGVGTKCVGKNRVVQMCKKDSCWFVPLVLRSKKDGRVTTTRLGWPEPQNVTFDIIVGLSGYMGACGSGAWACGADTSKMYLPFQSLCSLFCPKLNQN